MKWTAASTLAALLFLCLPASAQEISGNFKEGSVLVGNDTATCNATRDGALRFNSATNIWNYCNGSSWTSFGGGSPAGSDREIQFNSGGSFGTHNRLQFTSAGRLGIGMLSPTSWARASIYDTDTAPSNWKAALFVQGDSTGSSASYNGVVGIDAYSQVATTGAGLAEAYAIVGNAMGTNDAKQQTVYGVAGKPELHDTDRGRALAAFDDDDSTAGTVLGLYIYLDDTDLTRWGIYQESDNPNYFAGPIGIGTNSIGHDALYISQANTIAENAWHSVVNNTTSKTGNSASYNGFTAYSANVTNSVTGAGQSDARAYSTTIGTADDAGDSQEATGLHTTLITHPGDSGRGVYVRSESNGASTGGTQYGLYINLQDTDVTRYGIYQFTSNSNYLAGSITTDGSLSTTPPSLITLTVDNTLVTTTSRSFVRLTSDNTTATNRTFCLGAGTSGQRLVLEWTSGTNKGELVDNGVTCASSVAAALSATWTPAAADATLELIFNGTKWVQVAVSAN